MSVVINLEELGSSAAKVRNPPLTDGTQSVLAATKRDLGGV